jgi:tetratricopeptide (TPR) repeat protein
VAIDVGWYGEDHYLTAAANGVLAQTLIRMKRFDEAIPAIRRTIDIFSRTKEIGPTGANTSIARSSLGLALSGRGDHDAARKELEIALAGLKAALGDKNSNTLTTESNLAVEMTLQGHPDSAIALLRQVEARGLAAYGEQSVPVANIRAKLGDALFKAHRYPEAIATINTALAVLDQKLKGPAPLVVSSRQDLIAAYGAIGDTVSAARVRRQLADTNAVRAR